MGASPTRSVLAASQGIEPRPRGPEPRVLPVTPAGTSTQPRSRTSPCTVWSRTSPHGVRVQAHRTPDQSDGRPARFTIRPDRGNSRGIPARLRAPTVPTGGRMVGHQSPVAARLEPQARSRRRLPVPHPLSPLPTQAYPWHKSPHSHPHSRNRNARHPPPTSPPQVMPADQNQKKSRPRRYYMRSPRRWGEPGPHPPHVRFGLRSRASRTSGRTVGPDPTGRRGDLVGSAPDLRGGVYPSAHNPRSGAYA